MSSGEHGQSLRFDGEVEPRKSVPAKRGKSGGTTRQGPERNVVIFFFMPELDKVYNPQAVEGAVYKRWEASGMFNPDKLPNAKKRPPFVISMPPPNITGELHLGHALGTTIEDVLIRYHRMRGDAALYLPGTDHAAIATQVVVERELKKQGIDRVTIGREKFLSHVWKWKEQYGSRIVEQIRRLGASADWSRQRFTMDAGMSAAVQTAFLRLHRDKMIYRGKRIVNWCPDCRTAISDLEVDHEQMPGKLWHIVYPLTDGTGSVTVATTRPETMLGDTAVAVHPDDARYTAMVGKTVRLPLIGRDVPIIADHRIDREFGTGAVKVTPAHDPLDYDLGQTHNLPMISVIGADGNMLPDAGAGVAGMSVEQARHDIIQQLTGAGALEKEEDYIHAVATCSRSHTVIEPILSLQWFLKTKPLAEKALEAVRSGKVKIVPVRYEKVYFHWLENIRDWNISRQIWWGHRLPVWYRVKNGKEQVRVSLKNPGAGWHQDEDTLDTWFSSGLWTFSTLGWPKKTKDLARFHPTSVMETGWDILFFWVARMMMFSLYFMKEIPFSTIYLHGLVLDRDGKKMSKSKGTGIDPLPTADKYGMDAVRMSLIIGNAPGQDFRLYEEKIEGYRNFANKLWNVSRFILAQPETKPAEYSAGDVWILSRLSETTTRVTDALESFQLSTAGQALYDFVWHDLADWYIEYTKLRPNTVVLRDVLATTLKLLHPFMPFITEEIWGALHPNELLMIAEWPKPVAVTTDGRFEKIQISVSALRTFRTATRLRPEEVGEVVADADEVATMQFLGRTPLRAIERLVVGGDCAQVTLGKHVFSFPKNAVAAYTAWQEKERARLQQYIGGIEKKLANEQFVAHAPAEVVAGEREKLAAAEEQLRSLVV